MLARARVSAAISGAIIVVVVGVALPGAALTNATWNSNEWDNGTVGVIDCAAANSFGTRAAGQFLQPNTLPALPANVVEVKGVTVTNNGTRMLVDPAGLPAQGTPPATFYANPLDASALNSIQVNLTGLVQLPLATSAGVYNQYAQALSNGKSAGAAGAVNNSGGIALTGAPPPASLPGAASLDLTTLLTAALGGLGAGSASLATATVGIGAISSSATLDACAAAYSKNLAANLARAYNIASLDAVITAPIVSTTTTTIGATLTNLQTVVNGLTGPGGSLLGSVTALVNSLSAVTAVAGTTSQVTLGVAVDTTALQALLTTTQTDSSGLVSVNLATGTVDVNLAQLVGGLNGRDPNTQLLLDQVAITKVTTALSSITTALTTAVNSAITAAINTAQVTLAIKLVVPLVGTECVGLVAATLGAVVAGTSPLVALGSVNSVPCNGLLSSTLATTLNGLGVAASVGALIQPVLAGLLASGVSAPLVSGVVTPLTTLIAPVIAGILGNTTSSTGGLVSLVVNEQNAPIGATGPLPNAASWTSIPTGRYEVAALGLQVLAALGGATDVNVDLARSSVGASCPLGGVMAPCAGY